MRLASDFSAIGLAMQEVAAAQARASSVAMSAVTDGLKQELRNQVTSAGLGTRLANTWRGNTYPKGRPSLDPTSFVWSKAPKIIDAYDRGATIVPLDGRRYLAIPTQNVPSKGRGRRMTPLDVETSFNQDLIIRKGKNGHLLAFINAVAAQSARGWRRATPGRLAKGRDVKLVLMFVLVRQVGVAKRLDIQAAADAWAERVPELIDQAWI
jgi:hypothetical protein